MTGRFEVREQVLHGQAGWVPYDLQEGRPSEPVGMPDGRWSPSEQAVAAWCARENGSHVDQLPELHVEGASEGSQVVEGRGGRPVLP
jgi:hypothetical protein